MSITSNNPSALDLLKAGAKIEFVGGYYLKGYPDTKYINVGTQFGSEGMWDLSEEGLASAIEDLTKMAKHDGYTLDGTAVEDAGMKP